MQIDHREVYDDAALVLGLGLSSRTLTRARRKGRLRYTRQGHRILYLGRWILEWLEVESLTGDEAEEARRG